ncbi:MAG: hypothetical protein GF411_18920 [Candidatus Lokiarchaeota archaeon]|nr:hypothetical protein [Candidatus Lokiarchaeota archaeon]
MMQIYVMKIETIELDDLVDVLGLTKGTIPTQIKPANDRRRLDDIFMSYLAATSKGDIVEIGTSYGRGTCILASNTSHTVHTINPLPEHHTGQITLNMTKKDIGKYYIDLGLKNICQYYGSSIDWKYEGSPPNFCFIDGCHDKKYAYLDGVMCEKILSDGGWIAWHDFDPNSKEYWVREVVAGVRQWADGRKIYHLKLRSLESLII